MFRPLSFCRSVVKATVHVLCPSRVVFSVATGRGVADDWRLPGGLLAVVGGIGGSVYVTAVC